MATLSDLQAEQAAALTASFKAEQNRRAARIAALAALYYQQRVDPSSLASVEAWLEFIIPRLIRESDAGALAAANFYDEVRRLEVPAAPIFRAEPTNGAIDAGVRKSLLTVGPYAYENKMRQIERTDDAPERVEALVRRAKEETTKKVVAASIRHAQAGARRTVEDNVEKDRVALGWVRVTRAKPCFFCAMLASRGVKYRTYSSDSFTESDGRFTGPGDAKVHDSCGCSLKPVYTENDPLVKKTREFDDLWQTWGAGGGDAILRFRRGYEHYQETGEMLSWEDANEGLREV